jgi:hypothetical protein
MSRFLQGLVPHIKKFATYMGFNPEVATKNWPSRGTYRIAPASQDAPTFTHNFPLKQEQIADLEFVDRIHRHEREAMNVTIKHLSDQPRKDFRNVWTVTKAKTSNSAANISVKPDHLLPVFAQVSEVQEIHL